MTRTSTAMLAPAISVPLRTLQELSFATCAPGRCVYAWGRSARVLPAAKSLPHGGPRGNMDEGRGHSHRVGVSRRFRQHGTGRSLKRGSATRQEFGRARGWRVHRSGRCRRPATWETAPSAGQMAPSTAEIGTLVQHTVEVNS